MNYLEPSQFRVHPDIPDDPYASAWLTCTLCQADIEGIRDLSEALERADQHAQECHDAPLKVGK